MSRDAQMSIPDVSISSVKKLVSVSVTEGQYRYHWYWLK